MYFQKKFPHLPVIYRLNKKGTFDIITDYPKNTLMEAGGVGMGCCLIKTSVFKKMGADPFESFAATPTCRAISREDLAFCKRAGQRRIKIFVDTGIQAKHQTERYITEEYYEKSMAALKRRENHAPPEEAAVRQQA